MDSHLPRYCDIILPATTFIEREDILFPGLNYLFYSGRAVAPAGLSRFIEDPEGLYPLRMSTPHAKYRVNSQNGNIPHYFEKEQQRLLMHRQDAPERNIFDNEEVRVYSPVGETVVRAMVTDRCLQGVVVLHQGAWPAFSGGALQHRENPNFCTSSVPTRPSNGSRTHTVFVQVQKMGDRE